MRARRVAYFTLAFAWWCLAGIGAATAAPLIVEDGQPNAEIVIAENPPRTTRLAARELQRYVKKISGAELPVVAEPNDAAVKVYVGQSPHTERLGVTAEGLNYGAYRIVSGDDWLVLIGHDSDFTPTEPWARNREEAASEEFIQRWDEITRAHWGGASGGIYKYYTGNRQKDLPGFWQRPLREERRGEEEPIHLWQYDEHGSFNAVCGFLRSLGVRWYMPSRVGEVVPSLSTIALPKVDETVRPDFEIRRIKSRYGSQPRDVALWTMRLGLRSPRALGAHGLVQVTGREEMKQEHPEFYALYGDTRATARNKHCLSSPGVFEETVRYVQTMFDHYDYEMVSVMPNDGYTRVCECPLCEGKGTPERGAPGRLSDYVWDFVTRVAEEVAKTHPDKKIYCLAYGPYTYPPLKIDRLPPNVQVGIVGARRPTRQSPEERSDIQELRRGWLEKTDNKLINFENFTFTHRGHYLPSFVPHVNAGSINALKGDFRGEDIWVSLAGLRDLHAPGYNHFKIYFTARMYWGGKDRDIDALLNEYYRLFYGPTEQEMKAFFQYCEENWKETQNDRRKAERALALFAAARDKVDPDSVYGKRLALVADFLQGLKDRTAQLVKEEERKDAPVLRMWRGATDINVDGKLDEAFWSRCPVWSRGRLKHVRTGERPDFPTTFTPAWGKGGIYFAIRCEDAGENTVNVTTRKDDDPAILNGDAVTILLETQKHSYYQITFNPAGAVYDLDRAGGKEALRWDSQAEVGVHVDEDYWSVEIFIPVVADTNDPLHQVVGRPRPRKTLPWYFNVCRQRVRDEGAELSAFSPTGQEGFHLPEKLARLYYK